jgi:inorganic pyrophosphatase/exopolyphosphatase
MMKKSNAIFAAIVVHRVVDHHRQTGKCVDAEQMLSFIEEAEAAVEVYEEALILNRDKKYFEQLKRARGL